MNKHKNTLLIVSTDISIHIILTSIENFDNKRKQFAFVFFMSSLQSAFY